AGGRRPLGWVTNPGAWHRGCNAANHAAPFDRAKMGFRELVSYDVLGITFPANTVTTLRTTTSKRPDLIENFLKTLIEGIYIFKTNKPRSLAVMKKHLLGASDEVLEETYRYTSSVLEQSPILRST